VNTKALPTRWQLSSGKCVRLEIMRRLPRKVLEHVDISD